MMKPFDTRIQSIGKIGRQNLLRRLPSRAPLKQPDPISKQVFEEKLVEALCYNGRYGKRVLEMHCETIGLAISGGVDSMALASLCSRLPKYGYKFHAFVVDHGARIGSDLEAEAVKQSVLTLGIPTSVLKLKWPSAANPTDLSNFETSARVLRYQILGNACAQRGIRSLCTAHHADDQYETILMRLANGHGKSGLLGMRPCNDIPECFGLYGVSQSGRWNQRHSNILLKNNLGPALEDEKASLPTPKMSLDSNGRDISRPLQSKRQSTQKEGHHLIPSQEITILQRPQLKPPHDCRHFEDGGVKIVRPLLNFSKAALQASCEDNYIPWFEDHTNQDQTVTARNAIRHIIKHSVLPRALQKYSILERTARLQNWDSSVERMADDIYSAIHIMDLNLATGMMSVRFPQTLDISLLHSDSATRALHRLVEHVSPTEKFSKGKLDVIRDLLWGSDSIPEEKPDVSVKITLAGVLLERMRLCRWQRSKYAPEGLDPYCFWRLSRQPLTINEKQRTAVEFPSMASPQSNVSPAENQTAWRLWDGRYWIRIWHDLPSSIYVRDYRKEDSGPFLQLLDPKERKTLKRRLEKEASGVIRFSLPAIVMGDERKGEKSEVLALPSLGIHKKSMFFEDGQISYKILFKRLYLRHPLRPGNSYSTLPHAYPEPKEEAADFSF